VVLVLTCLFPGFNWIVRLSSDFRISAYDNSVETRAELATWFFRVTGANSERECDGGLIGCCRRHVGAHPEAVVRADNLEVIGCMDLRCLTPLYVG
jgi:hypothetical protein